MLGRCKCGVFSKAALLKLTGMETHDVEVQSRRMVNKRSSPICASRTVIVTYTRNM